METCTKILPAAGVALLLTMFTFGGCEPTGTLPYPSDDAGMDDSGMTDTMHNDPTPLSTCNRGTVTVTTESTERVDDLFSGLPNQWGWAQMYRGVDQEGNQTQDVYLLFGLSTGETVETAFAGDYLGLNIPVRIDGTSGSLGEFTSTSVGTSGARRTGGEYIGNGSGIWFVEDVSGSWQLASWEAGETMTGTATVTFKAGCATSLSRLTYSFDFSFPLAGLDGEIYNRCDNFGGADSDFQVGTITVTAGSQFLADLTADEQMVQYNTDADRLILSASKGDDAQMFVEVESPSIGQNQDSSAFYSEGDCVWRAQQASAVDVTLQDSGSGTLLEGPTSGSFTLDLPFFPDGSSGSCDESNRVIEGTFGMAVCSDSSL